MWLRRKGRLSVAGIPVYGREKKSLEPEFYGMANGKLLPVLGPAEFLPLLDVGCRFFFGGQLQAGLCWTAKHTNFSNERNHLMGGAQVSPLSPGL